MSVGILMVTHSTSGETLLEVAEFILGESMSQIRFIPFQQSGDRHTTIDEIETAMAEVDQGEGLLVLTDLIGASPSNLVAERLAPHGGVMVTGLNLAMLVCVWNYRDQPLGMLARKAVECGRRGVKIFQK